MITVIVDLSEDLPVERRKAYIEGIEANFPFNYTDYELAHNFGDEPQIMIQLAQEEITLVQEKYLDKFEYVREYNARPGTLQPETTLEPYQVEAIQEILENPVNKVPSNGNHTRFYTEPLAERQWDNEHHLIDIEGHEPMHSRLTIAQCSTSDQAQVVKLHYNEVDELLTALLQWRMDAAKASAVIEDEEEEEA
jgi:hypothetical protein